MATELIRIYQHPLLPGYWLAEWTDGSSVDNCRFESDRAAVAWATAEHPQVEIEVEI